MNQELQLVDTPGMAQAAASVSGSLPLVEELTPWLDPWEVAQQLARWGNLVFLDSAGGPMELRRYSFVAADPFQFLRLPERPEKRKADPGRVDPLSLLADWLGRYRAGTIADLPPFQGGAAGLFSYSLGEYLEHLPRPRSDEFAVPDLAVGLYDWVIGFDHEQNRAWIISTGFPELRERQRRHRAGLRLRQVQRWLTDRPAALHPGFRETSLLLPSAVGRLAGFRGVTSNFDRPGYLAAVQRCLDYLHAGDCYQVNLSQRLLAPARRGSLDLYGRLRHRNPAPFAGYLDLGDFAIASASPERFLRARAGQVETRPIKGTRPRGPTPETDREQIDDLVHSPKDRAENVMIVDLLRNDLGRVCRYGSIQVPAVCRLESFQTVHHLVSEVRGQLREGLGPLDALRAAFPGGSVTGAPKVRAMEIIAELEPTARGAYCGCLGYVGFDGSMDTNILIRTFTVGRGWVQFPVGGGIVADSVPEQEYAETWHKAKGLLRAL
jgi:para-aminobenzoate synthetase component 1